MLLTRHALKQRGLQNTGVPTTTANFEPGSRQVSGVRWCQARGGAIVEFVPFGDVHALVCSSTAQDCDATLGFVRSEVVFAASDWELENEHCSGAQCTASSPRTSLSLSLHAFRRVILQNKSVNSDPDLTETQIRRSGVANTV